MNKRGKPVIVVEGKSDVNKLRLFVDAEFVTTNGSEVSRETIEYLTKLSLSRQIIVLTDPDSPGERIRNLIDQAIPGCYHAFIDKKKAIKGKKVGVAECEKEELIRALKDLVCFSLNETPALTIRDLYDFGLIGKKDSSERRDFLGKVFHIGKTNGKTCLKRLNLLGIGCEELKEAMKEYENSK